MGNFNAKRLYCNLVTLTILSGVVYLLSLSLGEMMSPIAKLNQQVSLELQYLPGYLLRTGTRFFLAMLCSVIVAIAYAVLAAKNLRLRRFLLPLLDVFQSIPVLGFLAFTVTAFVNLAPGNVWGIEMAVIFAIMTAQVWNMIFSVYQSLITIPAELYEVAKIYKLNKWKTFWLVELPFAIPGLTWNIILSMSSSWFYVVAQEVISVGTQSYTMPGMGAYISLALQNMNIKALAYAALAIIGQILSFNELIFKPMVAWGDKFRYEFNVGACSKHNSWLLNYVQQSEIVAIIRWPFTRIFAGLFNLKLPQMIIRYSGKLAIITEVIWWLIMLWLMCLAGKQIYMICHHHLTMSDVYTTIKLGCITAIRVTVLLLLCSLIWVPVGIFIGMRPKVAVVVQPIAQFLTAIPANLYYPVFVAVIARLHLNPNIWLSAMIVAGSQWYILYNVIGGAQNIPNELLEAGKIFKIKWLHRSLKIILPAILPYYLAGLITAAGASWNSSIVAETMTWGATTLTADGLGSYIAINTGSGNFPHIALGLIVMSVFVVLLNKLAWKPLYTFVSTRYRLD